MQNMHDYLYFYTQPFNFLSPNNDQYINFLLTVHVTMHIMEMVWNIHQ